MTPWRMRSTEFPDRTIDRLFAQSVAESLDVGPGQLPDDPTPITLERVRGATAVEAGDCLAVETTGRSPLLDMAVPSASSLFISSENDSFAQVSVSLRGTYPVPGPTRELVVGEVTRLGVPDIGPDGSVGVRLDLPTQASFLLCLESP